MTASELLPDPEAVVRCADFSRRLGLDPGGSALSVDEILVVDVPLPWPKPVFAADGLASVPAWVDHASSHGRRVRVLAGVPLADGRDRRVVVHRRRQPGAPRLGRVEHRVDRDDVPDLLEALLVSGLDSVADTVVPSRTPPAELLICTQGSHDRCCGTDGTRLAAGLLEARPELGVRRVSHTGGHRFAPTGMTLPDGRMWGGLTVEETLGIVDRTTRPAAVVPKCRGWSGAPAGPGQVAERAVFGLVDDWSFEDLVRRVTVVAEGGGTTTVRVETSHSAWEVDVAVGREVPTIACGEPGGLPVKPGTEYAVAEVREVV